jgi:hypothetical protein
MKKTPQKHYEVINIHPILDVDKEKGEKLEKEIMQEVILLVHNYYKDKVVAE